MLTINKIIAHCGLLSALCVQLLATTPQTIVGSLPGDVVVDNSGQATYSIPLTLPPGTAGMTPELALSYSSGGGNGLMGEGWSLSGLSAITRGPQILDRDGRITAVDYAAPESTQDRLYLDGQRLLRSPAGTGYWNITVGENSTENEFRTEVEGHTQILLKRDSANSPIYFVARTKAGLIMEFGRTEGSRTTLSDGRITGWLINKISDTRGNYMTFEYSKDAALGAMACVIKNRGYSS